jgi:hypothetical protein
LIDRKSLIESLGLLAVIASLVFVALEIRQANQIAIGTTSYELNRNWMSLNDLYVTNADVRALMVALSDKDFFPKDELQREQAEGYARRILNNWVAIEEAHGNGIASDAFYLMATEDVKAMIAKRPGIVRVYETVAAQYDLTEYSLLEPLLEAIARLPVRSNDASN